MMDGSNLQLVEAGRIGRVIAVSAAQVIVLLEARGQDAAHQVQALEMGALVKLQTRASTVYGMVNAMRVPLPSLSAPDQDLKIVEIELLGEMLRDASGADCGFQRGVSMFPSIESPVFLATAENLAQVYAPSGTASVPVGTIYQADSVPAYLRINDLMG
jgi:hypothetical protein